MANTNGVPDSKPLQLFSKVAAQFYSASNIIEWFKNTVGVELKSLQDNLIGAAFCKVLQKLYPEVMNKRKTYFNGHTKFHCILNLKAFNQALQRLGVNKKVRIDLLDKENSDKLLAFAQWFRQFYEANNKLVRSSRVLSRRHSEARIARKAAVCDRVLATYCRPRSLSSAGVSKKLDNTAIDDRLERTISKIMRDCATRYRNEYEMSATEETCSSNLKNSTDTANLEAKKKEDYDYGGTTLAHIAYQAPNKPVEGTTSSATTDVKPATHPQAERLNPPTVLDEQPNAVPTTATLKGADQANCSDEAPVASGKQKYIKEYTFIMDKPGVRIRHILEMENLNPEEMPSKEEAGGESGSLEEMAEDACVRIRNIFEVENFDLEEMPSTEVAGGDELETKADKAEDDCDGADVEPKKNSSKDNL